MKTFRNFINENKSDFEYEVSLWMHPKLKTPHEIQINSNLLEKQYHKDEEDYLDGHLYKVLSDFKPSSMDHDTISREFHEHLHRHGYYSHTNTHPMVLSPRENTFKSEFKRRTQTSVPVHERPHHDGGKGQSKQTMGRHVAVWSSASPTQIHDKDTLEKIPDASQAGKPTIFNDEKVKHSASDNPNRWFLRLGEIRKIPKTGLQSPDGKGNVKQYGNNVGEYIRSKKKPQSKLQRNVREFLNSKHPKRQETEDWIMKNYPEHHPNYNSETKTVSSRITNPTS